MVEQDCIQSTFTEIVPSNVHGVDHVDYNQSYFFNDGKSNIYASLGYFYNRISVDSNNKKTNKKGSKRIVVAKPFTPGLPKGLFFNKLQVAKGHQSKYEESGVQREFLKQQVVEQVGIINSIQKYIGAPYDMARHMIVVQIGGTGEDEAISALDLLARQELSLSSDQ